MEFLLAPQNEGEAAIWEVPMEPMEEAIKLKIHKGAKNILP
jgi:hypothetical protein